MNVLVICSKFNLIDKPTISDHLYSFRRYDKKDNFYYLYVDMGGHIPHAVIKYPFDVVIFHYTFLANRFSGAYFARKYQKMLPVLKKLHGIKVMIPEDEYVYTDALWKLARDLGVTCIFTTYQKEDYYKVFPPEKVGENIHFYTVFPGYVEERVQKKLERKLQKRNKRPIDIGYRAQMDRFIFGEHGSLKSEIATVFQKYVKNEPNLNTDIQLITIEGQYAIKGRKWFDFLLSARSMLGVLGGSSLFDPTGCYRERTLEYTEEHPKADYKEVEQNCYPGADWIISNKSLGPKNFEYAMAKTCQVLMEGWYYDVLKPNRDYIEVKSDFSNLDDVIAKIKDKKYCEKIANQCYADVVLSGKYSYRVFVDFVMNSISQEDSKIERCRQCRKKQDGYLQAVCKCANFRIIFRVSLKRVKAIISVNLKKFFPQLHKKIKVIYKRFLS